MKKTIIFLISIIIITTTLSQVSGHNKITNKIMIEPEYPLPGYLDKNYFPIIEQDKIIQYSKKNYNESFFDNNIINIIQQIDEDLILSYLQPLVDFGPRLTGTKSCEEAGEYIFNELNEMGLDTRYQYWEYNSYSGNNIEATIHGYDQESDEIYIICAHYDTVAPSPGADDDGSGVAAVLTAANLLKNYNPKHSVKFITFSGEEQGLYGSHFYALEAYENNDNIIAVLNVDMIGFATNEEDEGKIKIFENEDSQWLLEYTIDVGGQYQNFINLEIIPSGYSSGSDHLPFWQAGYNAIFYFEYKFNTNYHSQFDTIENMNIAYTAKNVKLITATLASLADISYLEAPEIPTTPEGKEKSKVNVEQLYTTDTTDPQDDEIYYLFDWGDGTQSQWIGPFPSGEKCTASHKWVEKGNYEIKVKARDPEGHESDWSEPLTIAMPKNKIITNNQIETIIKNFILFFTNIFNKSYYK